MAPRRVRYVSVASCPVNGARCSQRCFMREACRRDPEAVAAELERMDGETALALARLVMSVLGLRAPRRHG